jgi:F-type H+-transporting ATPase subunit b
MTFNVTTFLFEIVNFLVLAYILQRLLYRPLHDALDRRRQAIEQAQAEAERARQEAEEERRQLDERLALIEEQRQVVLREARQTAEAERDHILAQAAEEAERRAALAREALARDRDRALQSLRQDIVREAGKLAERLLQEASGSDLDALLAARLADAVSSLPPKEQELLTHGWGPGESATLESAHDLAPEVVDQVHDAVSRALGRDITLRLQSAPELVAGVRLRLDGHVWDASLAGQLGGIDDERTSSGS